MIEWLQNLCAALILFAVVCVIGGWWLSHEAAGTVGVLFVTDGGRE